VCGGRNGILLDTTFVRASKEMERLYLVGEELRSGAGCTLSRTLARLVGKSTENTIRITSLSG
jgi:hypothetical protein